MMTTTTNTTGWKNANRMKMNIKRANIETNFKILSIWLLYVYVAAAGCFVYSSSEYFALGQRLVLQRCVQMKCRL